MRWHSFIFKLLLILPFADDRCHSSIGYCLSMHAAKPHIQAKRNSHIADYWNIFLLILHTMDTLTRFLLNCSVYSLNAILSLKQKTWFLQSPHIFNNKLC